MKLGKTAGFAEGRARRGDFSMVLTRLARFTLPQQRYGGSKSQRFSLPRKSRVKRDHRKRRSERARTEAGKRVFGVKRPPCQGSSDPRHVSSVGGRRSAT